MANNSCCYVYNNDENMSMKFKATISSETPSSTTQRRSANYKPSTWSSADFLESLRKDHDQDIEDEKVERLKLKVKDMLGDEGLEPSTLLKLIDDVQRLGLMDHFDKDIESVLSRLATKIGVLKLDLNSTALLFRIFRQNGIWMSQDEFARFKDDEGNFLSSLGNKDIEGMLNLYEASYLSFVGEGLLDEAKSFTRKFLSDQLYSIEDKKFTVDYVNHTLEIPLQYRIPRLEARHFIQTYHIANENDLLELAKLDFNMVQAMHQRELHELSMWWKGTGLANRLSFARDRLTECFFCSIAVAPKPQFSACRKALTKVYQIMTIIDDIYDVHGYLDELELFTIAVERWDVNDIDHLPDYMKSVFIALYNIVTEIGYEILKEKGHDCIPSLRKSWEDLCKAFLVEAKWYYNGQTPQFEDYLHNGWVSSSVGMGLTHAYFYVTPKITPDAESLNCLLNNNDILRFPSIIFRLANDLSTSQVELERGETANAISCYAKQYGVSFEDARKHMNKLIDENWQGINAIRVAKKTPFTNDYMEVATNHARIAQCLYQHGDGYGSPDLMKKRVSSLIIDPLL